MIITKTPLRVSLFGGGTDHPAFYEAHGHGEVVGFAIDKFVWVTLRRLPPFFEYRHRIVWSAIELAGDISEIGHPVVRSAFEFMPPHCGVEMIQTADLPARSGLGSSSSFTVGLVHALHALRGHQVRAASLVASSLYLERTVLKENVGDQDQCFAAYGGFQHITFTPTGRQINPVVLSRERVEELSRHLMLFFTGFSRMGSAIEGRKIAGIKAKASHLTAMRDAVGTARDILHGKGGLDPLGELLHETWQLKRDLAAGVSTDSVDEIYAAARSAGARGGKLLGAGGGGFMLLYARPSEQGAVRQALKGLVEVDFKIGAEGSRVVLYEPEGFGGTGHACVDDRLSA